MNDCAYMGMSLFERWEKPRHQPSASGSDAAKTCFALNFGVTRMNIGFDVLSLVNNAASALDDDSAFLGQCSTVALNEHNSKIFLEARDMGGDIALHRSEGPSSTRK
jgi:hypothetical protein